MSTSPAFRIATAGEALIDLVQQADGRLEPCLGGAVYNLSRALARQGHATLYLNPLSADRFGRRLAQGLIDDGVGLAVHKPVAEVTSLAVVGLDERGHPDYAFYREHVADRAISAASLNRACAAAGVLEVVCTGALALAVEDGPKYLPWLQSQRELGKLVVVDANLRPSVMQDLAAYRQHVVQALRQAHIIKVSDEDLAVLGLPGDTPLDQARALLAQTSAQWLGLTLGPQGAMLLRRALPVVLQALEAAPIAVVDTVGAGDCFLAGLVAALLHAADASNLSALAALSALAQAQCHEVLSHALVSASLCVLQRGCVPPTWAQARSRLEQYPVSLRTLPV